MIDERKAAAGFLALLTALLGFYTLGLRLGPPDIPAQGTPAAPSPPPKAKANAPDVRSELEFINSARLDRPDTAPGNSGKASEGGRDKSDAGARVSGYAVQLSFNSREEGERASQRLQMQGFRTRTRNNGSTYRLEIGPYPARSDAESAAAKLAGMGFSTSVTAR